MVAVGAWTKGYESREFTWTGFPFFPLLPWLLPTSLVGCQVFLLEPSLFPLIIDIRSNGFLVHSYARHRFVF